MKVNVLTETGYGKWEMVGSRLIRLEDFIRQCIGRIGY